MIVKYSDLYVILFCVLNRLRYVLNLEEFIVKVKFNGGIVFF